MADTTSTSSGLLVIRRINPLTDIPIDSPVTQQDARVPALALSHEEIRTRYRGFEGWPWPDDVNFALPQLKHGLAVSHLLPAIEDYYEEVSKVHLCDLIYLDFTEGISASLELPPKFKFLGYDYGYYVWEYNHFSSLFHEVIYGIYDEMKSYAGMLNDHLLLPDVQILRSLHSARTRLLENGADLERDGEGLGPIAIYGPPHQSLLNVTPAKLTESQGLNC